MAVTGEVLEHRQDSGVAQPLGVRPRVLGDLGGIGTERAVADHLVVGFLGHVDDRREVDGDAQLLHRLPALERDVVDLLRGVGVGQHPRRRLAADELRQPLHPAALLVDADRERQRADLCDVGDGAVGQHRQVRPAADEDPADVVVGHDRAGIVASVTPTISNCASLSLVDMAASNAGPSPHAGGAGDSGACGDDIGVALALPV